MSDASRGGPLVTIGVPTRNRREYLLRALRSLYAQSYDNLQIVVSDNCSSDDTADFLLKENDPRLEVIYQPQNIGMVGNFNACLNAAKGELFLMLSDDDQLLPAAVEELTAPFREAADGGSIGVVWCPCEIIDAEGKAKWSTAAGPERESAVSLIENLWLGHRGPRLSSVMARTADVRRVGGYDDARFGYLCDTGNWGQVALGYADAACVPRPLVQYRVHPGSETASSECQQWQRWGVNLHAAMMERLEERRDERGAAALRRLRKPLLANLTVDVLLRGRGSKGWLRRSLEETWKGRSFMFTPYVFRRAAKEGWKLLRMR